jgi:asparagine synthase (glutamine-hydrolysing)
MLAVTRQDGVAPSTNLAGALSAIGLGEAAVGDLDGVSLATWGLDRERPSPNQPLLLSTTNWSHNGNVPPAQLARWLSEGSLDQLRHMLPPFAALGAAQGGVRVAADQMGFRQLYRANGVGWTAVSTSARALAALAGGGLDETALLLQSQLGWQLGQLTLFSGVTKLEPGEAVLLAGGRARRELASQSERELILPDEAVREAETLLRGFLERYLDENPDPTLQLTGGQDSRILLSAIPRARRRGLKVMTVDAPGTGDAALAAQLTARYGMRHTVHSLDGLAGLSPADCFELVCAAASRLDCMADPLARAATLWVEQYFEQGARLSGLGGEVARGFYYTGRVHPKAVTRRRAEQLAKWRMFANEPVDPAALADRFARNALPIALDLVHQAIAEGGPTWYVASDELYYRHRMQRWAGLGETAVCFDRSLTNPMLDDRFIAIARALNPRDKQGSRFLARLQLALDEELGSIPLDNRPSPRVYAEPGPMSRARQRASRLRLSARKARQRLLRAHRPPPGAAVIAGKLAEHIRENRMVVDPARETGVFDERWLDGVGAGTIAPAPSSLALLVNVLVATGLSSDQSATEPLYTQPRVGRS